MERSTVSKSTSTKAAGPSCWAEAWPATRASHEMSRITRQLWYGRRRNATSGHRVKRQPDHPVEERESSRGEHRQAQPARVGVRIPGLPGDETQAQQHPQDGE